MAMAAGLMGDRTQRGNREGAPSGPPLLQGPTPVFDHLSIKPSCDESIKGLGRSSQDEHVQSYWAYSRLICFSVET